MQLRLCVKIRCNVVRDQLQLRLARSLPPNTTPSFYMNTKELLVEMPPSIKDHLVSSDDKLALTLKVLCPLEASYGKKDMEVRRQVQAEDHKKKVGAAKSAFIDKVGMKAIIADMPSAVRPPAATKRSKASSDVQHLLL